MTGPEASVLVVSPDAELCQSVLQWATSIQIPAVAARSGAEALERVLSGQAGLIFYNLRADHLSDLVAFARLRELPGGRELPVVALVAPADLPTARQYGQALGIREYLTTPPTPVDLARQLTALPSPKAAAPPKKPTPPPASYPNYTGPITLAELREVHCQMGAMSHFERLGVTPTVDAAGVRAAYEHLAGRYSVDSLSRTADDESRHLCRDIHNLLGEAYSVLRDPRRRTQYEESRESRPTADERPAPRGRRVTPTPMIEAGRARRGAPAQKPPALAVKPPPKAEPARGGGAPDELADEATRAAFEALAALEEAERAQAAEPPAVQAAPEPAPAPQPKLEVAVPARAVEMAARDVEPPAPEAAPEPDDDPFSLGDANDAGESMVPNFDDDIFVFDMPDSGEDALPDRPPREPTAEPSHGDASEADEPETFNPALAAARAQQQRTQAAADTAAPAPVEEPLPEPQRTRRPAEQVLARTVDDIAAAAFMMALMGRYDSAVPLYERCYSAAPSARLRYDLELCRGRLAAHNGDDDTAEAHFQAAMDSAPRGRTEAAEELEALGGRRSKGRFSRLFSRE